MDINLNYSEDENPLALKSDFVLSFCELVMGGKNGLEAIEKTVIDRAVQVIYRPYLADPRPENMPILSDLHKALLDQHIPEADRVAQALDLYVNGSLNVFNHRTNVNIENRIVAFDIKELGKQLKKLGMLIVQDQIWGRVTENRNQGKATWYFCDEFHLLLREEQTAAFSCEIWKRFRKWGGMEITLTILQMSVIYAVLTEAERNGQEYQRERNGKGFASPIRVEVPGQRPGHTQRIGLEPRFATAGNITAPRVPAIVSACGAEPQDKKICYAGCEQTYRWKWAKAPERRIKSRLLITFRSPQAQRRTSKTCFLLPKSRTFWRTATSFAY